MSCARDACQDPVPVGSKSPTSSDEILEAGVPTGKANAPGISTEDGPRLAVVPARGIPWVGKMAMG